MNPLPSPDLAERLFQGFLHLLGAPRPVAAPAVESLDARAWGRAYAHECQRLGAPLSMAQAMQRGMDRWVTAFPERPELAARADIGPELENTQAGDTVPAAFMMRRPRP